MCILSCDVHQLVPRVREGDEAFEELPRIRRPPTRERRLVIDNCVARPSLTVCELAAITHSPRSKNTARNILRTSGKVSKLSQVVPHALNNLDKKRCVDVCSSQYALDPNESFSNIRFGYSNPSHSKIRGSRNYP